MWKETEIFRYRSRMVALTTFQLLANFRAFSVVSSRESFVSFKLIGGQRQNYYFPRLSLSHSSCIMSYTLHERVCRVQTYWAAGSHDVIQTEHKKKFGGSNMPTKSTGHNFARKLEKKGSRRDETQKTLLANARDYDRGCLCQVGAVYLKNFVKNVP